MAKNVFQFLKSLQLSKWKIRTIITYANEEDYSLVNV
jgi:hypothetical protein